MSKKPYMWGKLEWLEFSQKKDWNDPTVNPDDLAKYSELQRPYALPDGVDNYPAWEWSWPDINFPDIPDIITYDPIEHPCNIEDSCTAIGIIGPEEMECGDCYPYTHVHVIVSCEPQWWMAFGSWSMINKAFSSGDCSLNANLLFGNVCCTEDASGAFTIRFDGPLGCSDEIDVSVGCDQCCEEVTLEGAGSVAAGSAWVGIISPACPNTECEVSGNCESLGCSLNEAGSQVTVGTGETNCGNFTVTITSDGGNDNCPPNVASAVVTITGTGGTWCLDTTQGCGTGGGCGAGCNIGSYAACITQPYRYGTGQDLYSGANACRDNWSRQCKGCGEELPCCTGNSFPPPCGGTKSCSGGAHHQCDGSPCSEGGDCCCANYGCWRCKWICTADCRVKCP